MATTIVTKSGSGAPAASDLVAGELAVDLTNGRLYTEDSGGTVLELGLNPSGNVDITGTATMDGLTVQTTNGLNVLLESSNSYQYLQFKNTGETNNFIGFINDDFVVSPANTQKLILTAEGSVGINTTSPAATLHTVANAGTTGFLLTGAASNNIASFHTSGGSQAVTLDASGNVGIGTTSVTAKVHAVGADSNGTDLATSASNAKVRFENHSGSSLSAYQGYTGNSWYTQIANSAGTSSYDLSLNPYGGNVGIGTGIPDQLLQLGSETYAANSIIKTQVDGSDAGDFDAGLHMRSHNDDFGGSIVLESRSATNDLINFKYHNNSAAGVSAMAIDATNGNVGIGNSGVASTRLAVTNSVVGANIETTSSTAGHEALIVNRQNSDGTAIAINKAGTTVGSIGADSSDLVIDGSASNHAGLRFMDSAVNPRKSGSLSNGAVDLGGDIYRWKDLYLSGNISTGTGAANANNYQIKVSAGTTGLSRFIAADTSDAGYIDYEHSSDSWIHRTAGAEAMRLDTNQNLLVGRTSTFTFSTNTTDGIVLSPSRIDVSSASLCRISQVRNSVGTYDRFYNNAAIVGSISGTTTATAYNTSSDQRLKDNIVDAPSASDDIDAIQVRSFDWKADGSHQKYGMVAQELQSVAPEAVSGDADSEEMMGVDYSKLVPMMLKEIQSLRARVAQLES